MLLVIIAVQHYNAHSVAQLDLSLALTNQSLVNTSLQAQQSLSPNKMLLSGHNLIVWI